LSSVISGSGTSFLATGSTSASFSLAFLFEMAPVCHGRREMPVFVNELECNTPQNNSNSTYLMLLRIFLLIQHPSLSRLTKMNTPRLGELRLPFLFPFQYLQVTQYVPEQKIKFFIAAQRSSCRYMNATGRTLLLSESQTLLNAFIAKSMQTLHDQRCLANVTQTDWAQELGIEVLGRDCQACSGVLDRTGVAIQVIESQHTMCSREGFFPFGGRVEIVAFVRHGRKDGPLLIVSYRLQ
jgi:hypothetical protein